MAIGLYVLHSFVPFPAQILTFTIGAVYGPVGGVILSWVAAMAGAAVAFGLARWGGRPLAERFVPRAYLVKFDTWVERYGVRALLGLRLIPLVSFDLMNYAAGLSRVPWWTFLWTTGLGILPMTVLEVVAADQLRQGKSAGLWLIGAAVLLTALVWIWKRRREA
jgi:uncharacterized membrane protein YdjX (TVP38/TMEM64 family)